ncbi:MAG: ZPR1 zinc finger domain-containing protein [archaeon]
MADDSSGSDDGPSIIDGQPCPMCNEKSLTLMEDHSEIPYFGQVFLFSMSCSACKYHKADVEAAEKHEGAKYEFEVDGEEDLKVRVVKSGNATIKIPHIITITPGVASNGFISNIEGVLNRVKAVVESAKETEEDADAKKKAKNILKKLSKVLWGQEKLKIIIEDPTGNSAIISDKTKKSKMKG